MFRSTFKALASAARALGTALIATAMLALGSANAYAGISVSREVTIQGLDPNGFLIEGTTELTFVVAISYAENPNINSALQSLGIQQTLPARWTYKALAQVDPENPVIPDIRPNAGNVAPGFAWITPPSESFILSWKVNVPANEAGPVDVSTDVLYRVGGPEIVIPDLKTIQLAPTTVSAARQVGGDGLAGLNNQYYRPGGTISVAITISKTGPQSVDIVTFTDNITNGLTLANVGGTSPPDVRSPDGTTGSLQFGWNTVPALPFTFTYELLVPESQTGNVSLQGLTDFEVTSGVGSSTTPVLTLTERPCVSVSRVVQGLGCYTPGQPLTVEVTLTNDCNAEFAAFAHAETLPAGWTFVSATGLPANAVKPQVGFTSPLDFIFITPPTLAEFPIVFTYTVNVAANEAAEPAIISGGTQFRVGLNNTLFLSEAIPTEVPRYTVCADIVPPVLTLIGSSIVNLECGGSFNDPGASAIDDRDGNISGAVDVTGSVDPAAPGTYTLTYNVVDAGGNAATPVIRTVNVVDSTKPTLTLLGSANLNLQCGGNFSDPGVSANDACEGNIVDRVTVSNTIVEGVPGNYTVTYNVSDTSGNAATTISRSVRVVDTAKPVLTLVGNASVTLACGATFNDPKATSLDACDGDISAGVVVSGLFDPNTPGSYVLAYRSTDTGGNEAVPVTRAITVTDTVKPVLTLIGATPFSLECGATFEDPGATAIDACEGDLSAAIAANSNLNSAQPGSYVVTYTVSDSAGNESNLIRAVNVVDTTKPEITLNGNSPMNVDCGSTFNDPGVSAIDTCDANVSVLTNNGSLDMNEPGSYTISYIARDDSDNVNFILREVVVRDVTAPVLTLRGAATVSVQCGTSFFDQGATAADACEGDVTARVQSSGAVDANQPGTYTLLYNVSDSAGNASTPISRTVTVSDTLAPTLTLNGAANITIECGGTFTDPGASAEDSCGPTDLSGQVVVTGSTVETDAPGTYTLTYSVTDDAGNPATQVTRTVNVVDTQAPIITLNGANPLILECAATYQDPGATAVDACDDSVTLSSTAGLISIEVPGNFSVIYTARDGAGNTRTATRTLVVTEGPFCGPEGEGGEGEGEGEGDGEGEGGEGEGEGEGEGQAEPCDDRNNNGFIDQPFDCLVEEGDTRTGTVTAAGGCRRVVVMTTWYGDIEGYDIEIVLPSADDPNQVLTVTAPRALAQSGEQAILVIAFACSLDALVGRNQAAQYGELPLAEVGGISYFDVSILISADGGETYGEIDPERVAENPVGVSLDGLLFSNGQTPTFVSHPSRLVDVPGSGLALGVDEGAWGIDGLVQLNSSTTSITAKFADLSTFAPVEGAPQSPIIGISPTSGNDVIVGITEINKSIARTITLRNNGGGTLVGQPVLIDSAGKFAIENPGAYAIPPGGTYSVTVLFTPTAIGDYFATLQLDGGIGGRVDLTLRGTATEFVKTFFLFGCNGSDSMADGHWADFIVLLGVLALLLGARQAWVRGVRAN